MKFLGYVGYDIRNNLVHFGVDRFNSLGLGFLFHFLGPWLLATSRNTGWMDIHEIFRIWTQEAIGFTVLRLIRLFHSLQTRRGGGLRSRSASCYMLGTCWQTVATPRDHFVYAPSQWKKKALQCNTISHWLGAYTKWSMNTSYVVYSIEPLRGPVEFYSEC